MAKLLDGEYPGDWESDWSKGVAAEIARTDKLYRALAEAQPDADAKDLKGAILRFPRADGYAVYIVVKHAPLTLQHLPVGDAWHADRCTIKGVDVAEVRKQLRSYYTMRELFG